MYECSCVGVQVEKRERERECLCSDFQITHKSFFIIMHTSFRLGRFGHSEFLCSIIAF